MKDIKSRKNIETLVNQFYEKVKQDEIIGYLFTEVAQTNWNHHLPKMYDFWEVILLGTGSFKGNPMLIHKELHHKSSLSTKHFEHWIELFKNTVDQLYQGENAESIKQSAYNIAHTMMYKVLS